LKYLIALVILWFVPWVFVYHAGLVVYFPYEPRSTERYMRATGPLLSWLGLDDDWVSDIPRSCRTALVAAEDMNFYDHWGVDIDSIQKAMKRNERRGRIRWGASTITQQLVKNVFLSRKRSYIRKAREVVGAALLDLILNKDSQIKWYFNVVEFGPRTYGLGAAARRYFKKSASKLTPAQCVALVSVLPDPNRTYTSLTGSVPGYVQARRDRIWRAMGRIP
jgi:monofunctional biosynthetic peptidoglycan transglycosylase